MRSRVRCRCAGAPARRARPAAAPPRAAARARARAARAGAGAATGAAIGAGPVRLPLPPGGRRGPARGRGSAACAPAAPRAGAPRAGLGASIGSGATAAATGGGSGRGAGAGVAAAAGGARAVVSGHQQRPGREPNRDDGGGGDPDGGRDGAPAPGRPAQPGALDQLDRVGPRRLGQRHRCRVEREAARGRELAGRRRAGQRRAQRRPHLARAVETILGRLAERAQADRLQLGADRRMRRRRQRRIGDVLHRHVVGAVAVERRPPRQHVIEDDAGRVDVAASIGLLAARLFGRHVSGRADQRAVHGRPRAARLAAAAVALDRAQRGDAEVAHLRELGRLAVIAGRGEDHDVVGLEIAVDDLHVVRHRDRRQHLRHEVDDARVAERPLVGDDVVKRPPLDVFHRQVEQRFVDVPEVEHAHRVRMVQARRRARLALEPLHEIAIAGDVLAQHLERDHAVERELARAVDRAGAARRDQRLHDELAGDAPANQLGRVRPAVVVAHRVHTG